MFLDINGKKLHYVQDGSGIPIVLLHGNGENLTIFRESIELLRQTFTVYAVDMAGHGKSSYSGEMHYDALADDIYGLIRALNLKKPLLYGFSDGGIVGLILAIKYPDLLSKLIVSGVNLDPAGLNAVTRFQMRLRYLMTRSKKIWMMLTEPHLTKQDLRKIKVPTFLTAGQYDCIRREHTNYICTNIRNCHMKIFRHCLHGSYVIHSKRIAKYILAVGQG